MLQYNKLQKTVTCAVYIHWSCWRWKQWEINCSTPHLEDGVTRSYSLEIFLTKIVTNFSIPLHLLLVHQTLPPSAVSSCSGCLSCSTRRNVAIKCVNWDHLSALPPKRWHTPLLTSSPTSVPNSSFLSACFVNTLRQHLNVSFIYTFFVVFLLLFKLYNTPPI